jgi:hypothetical protein
MLGTYACRSIFSADALIIPKKYEASLCRGQDLAYKVGGIKVAELNLLKLEFLYKVGWKVLPNPKVLVNYYCSLVEQVD